MPRFSHFDSKGRSRMVDVTRKKPTRREATARGAVWMRDATLARIERGEIEKGEVLAVARVAAIQAAKRTSDWIPMCHPLAVSGVDVVFEAGRDPARIDIAVTVRCQGPTGVEMEALTAATAAALTIYDMCKAVDRGMRLGPFVLSRKSGGRSGLWEMKAAEGHRLV